MFSIEDFRSDLEGLFPSMELAMTYVASVGDVDTLTDFFLSTLSTLLEKHALSTDITFRARRSNEWFDGDCRKAKVRPDAFDDDIGIQVTYSLVPAGS